MKVFVAGGTGIIGRRAVRLLVAGGHEVTAMSRSESKDAMLRELGAKPVRCDLFDPASLIRAVAGHEVVINLATNIPPIDKAFKRAAWATNDRIRTEGSANLVDAALSAGSDRFIQESITFPYSDCGADWIDERVDLRPSPATRTTLDAEASARRFAEAGGSAVVLRFGAFYAPDASHTKSSIQMVHKNLAPVLGPRSAYQSSVHADDAAAAVVAALAAPTGTYNVVDDEPLTRAEVITIMARAAQRTHLRRLPGWLMTLLGGATARLLMRSQRVSNSAFREATGWQPHHRSMRTGWPAVYAAAVGVSAVVETGGMPVRGSSKPGRPGDHGTVRQTKGSRRRVSS